MAVTEDTGGGGGRMTSCSHSNPSRTKYPVPVKNSKKEQWVRLGYMKVICLKTGVSEGYFFFTRQIKEIKCGEMGIINPLWLATV